METCNFYLVALVMSLRSLMSLMTYAKSMKLPVPLNEFRRKNEMPILSLVVGSIFLRDIFFVKLFVPLELIFTNKSGLDKFKNN